MKRTFKHAVKSNSGQQFLGIQVIKTTKVVQKNQSNPHVVVFIHALLMYTGIPIVHTLMGCVYASLFELSKNIFSTDGSLKEMLQI